MPRFFWRQQPGVQLTDQSHRLNGIARLNFTKVLIPRPAVRDLLSTLGHIRAMKGCSGKVGSVGYCLGGKLAYLMATRSDVDASVGYYGVELDKYLDEIHDIRMPLMLHIAALDKFVPPDVRGKILKAAARNPVSRRMSMKAPTMLSRALAAKFQQGSRRSRQQAHR